MELTKRERINGKRVYDLLAGCTVLLKKDGTFPLAKAGEIALYGNGARHMITGGTGSGEVNCRFTVNPEQGLRAAGFTITTGAWLDAYDDVRKQAHLDFVEEIRRRAKENHHAVYNEAMGAVMPEPEFDLPLDGAGDAAVYVLARISGEGNDRVFEKGDILLTDSEVRDILELNRRYEKFMLVLNVGGPVDLSPVMEVGNILLLSQLGALTGRVLADILLGNKQPSGKLATTWAFGAQQEMDFGDRDETRYREGIYVGYRYYSTFHKEVQFPFGYGLGYTEFAVRRSSVYGDDLTMTVEAEVRNTGAHPGREVVQLYVSPPQGRLDKPALVLGGWAKTRTLKPGETETVAIRMDLRDIASYDTEKAQYLLEKGGYELLLGTDSQNAAFCHRLVLEDTFVLKQVRNALDAPDFADLKPEGWEDPAEDGEAEGNTPGLSEKTVDYDTEEQLPEEILTLSPEELITLSVGAHGKSGVLSVIGNAARSVAGAAGATPKLEEKGFPELVMADGPAGVRVTPRYWKKGESAIGIGTSLVGGLEEFLPKPAAKLLKGLEKKPPKKAEILEQYATAIPIGTALAQSFDLELAQQCGDIVGEEMQAFGVHLWLAPALNIHRSIRCGRNFEYFSEDPLVTGKMAAALTKGVQSHAGCGVTIKHYAANNQETSRYHNNSMVSERAMREIYLRGFEICIREAQPKAVMTSYNLLNGVHTAERKDLMVDILRSEFGFDGLLMTDWWVPILRDKAAKYPFVDPAKVVAAGGGIVMPGSTGDVKAMLQAYHAGELPLEPLQKHAAKLFALCKELRG